MCGMLVTNIKPNLKVVGTSSKRFFLFSGMPTETISNLFGEESPVRGDSVFSFVTRFVASKVTFHSFSAYLSFFSISVRLLGMFFSANLPHRRLF